MGRVSDAKEKLMEAVTELIWTGSYDGTTIDQICERAGVKKGSFYYFFDNKAQLAEAALDREWENYRPDLDAMFSASISPLQRIENFCDYTYRDQVQLKEKYGFALGCPLCTLGSEVSTQENNLRKKVQDMMNHHMKYMETAVRDGMAVGEIPAGDPKVKSRMIHAYFLGLMTEVRIANDLEPLKDGMAAVKDMLGISSVETVTA